MEATPPPLDRSVWLVAPLVFTSGLCALVYQTAWQREFRLVFGASTAASAAVVAVFMGGLGLGGWVIGPRTDKQTNPLRFYAGLEAITAVTAVATAPLLQLVRRVYVSMGGTVVLGTFGGTAARLLLAAVVLLPPTFMAGGTLGAAARAAQGEGDGRRRGMALLYGLNTLGAVTGCLLATFLLLEKLGTRSTLCLAGLANLAVAFAAALGSRSAAFAPADPSQVSAGPASPDAALPPPTFVLAAAAIVGFAFFLMELVWYRMLGPILGGTVYTFGLVLAIALLGIATGGLLYPLVTRRRTPTVADFALTCLLEAGSIALPYFLGDNLALLANALRPAKGSPLSGYLGGWSLLTALVVLLPSIVAGAQFPLLVALLGSGRARLARHIGNAYFWNTVGGIVGALAGGFGLMPLLTAPGCWKAACLLLAGLALAAAFLDPTTKRRLPVWGLALVALSTSLILARGPTAVWRHSSIGVGRANVPASGGENALHGWLNDMRRAIVWEREGVESSVAVQSIAGLSFVVNGKVDGNARNDAPTQVMSGVLGALLNPSARRSLVIGLGTGSTAGWLAAIPEMDVADVVELEPSILDVARMCGPVNHGAMDNPRVHVRIGDAREALMVGRGAYDIVVSEPSNPYRAGVASLFTEEFYASVKARLARGGLFLQWVQAYDVDDWTVDAVVATLHAVFPEIEIWQVHQGDLLFVASREHLHQDADAMRARIAQEPFRTALRGAWRAVELEDLLARFVAGPAVIRSLCDKTNELNTDDRNLVEFAFARTLSRSELFDVSQLRRAAEQLGASHPDVSGAVDWERVRRQRVAIYNVADTTPPLEPSSSESERTRSQAHAQYLSGDLGEAVKTFRRQDRPAEGPVDTELFAEGLAELGDTAAVPFIHALKDVEPTEAAAATARLAFRLGRPEVARDALVSALVQYRTDPWPSQVSMSHALALADELTVAHPEMVPMVFEGLGEPFAVSALEEPRRIFRLSVSSHGGLYRCLAAMAPFEPYCPWRADVLKYRADCYALVGDPRAMEARLDLEAYKSREAAYLARGEAVKAKAP